MDKLMLYLTMGFLALVVVFWVSNLFVIKKKDRASVWLNRGLYISGILTVICNFFRVLPMEMAYKETMQAANAVALVCIIISFVRAELGKNSSYGEYVDKKDDKDAESEKEHN